MQFFILFISIHLFDMVRAIQFSDIVWQQKWKMRVRPVNGSLVHMYEHGLPSIE